MTEVPTRDDDVTSLRSGAGMTSTAAVIEQAKQAISARMGTTPDVAFELLRGLALSQRRNLHDYAAEVVRNGGRLDV